MIITEEYDRADHDDEWPAAAAAAARRVAYRWNKKIKPSGSCTNGVAHTHTTHLYSHTYTLRDVGPMDIGPRVTRFL